MKKLLTILFAVALGLNLSAQVPDYVPTDGLVAWYPLNGDVLDIGPTGMNGVNYGAQCDENRNQIPCEAMSFTAGDYLSVPADYSFTSQEGTMTGWVKLNSYAQSGASGYNHFFNRWEVNSHEFVFAANIYGLYMYVENELFQSDTLPNLNEWHHLAFSYSSISGMAKIYIDGQNIAEFEGVDTVTPTNHPLHIGGNPFVPVYNSVDGSMDDVGIWNRALSEEEILALYNAEPPISGCIDPTACNYNEEATSDDGSCVYPPFVELGDDIATCEDSVFLDAGEGFTYYEWNTGDTSRSILVQEAGEYSVITSNTVPNEHALQFNGIDASAQFEESILFGVESFSVSVDCRLNAFAGNDSEPYSYIIGHPLTGGTNDHGFKINTASNSLNGGFQAHINDEGTTHFNVISFDNSVQSNVELDQWYDLTMVVDRDNALFSFYVDGVLVEAQTIHPDFGNLDHPNGLSLGIQNIHQTSLLNGYLDNLHVWDIALNEEQVAQLQTTVPTGNEEELVGFWDFEEGEGNEANEANGSASSILLNNVGWTDDGLHSMFDFSCSAEDSIQVSFLVSGCLNPEACNYNALAECEGEACDYMCCPGPGCCSAGMFWDYELEQCMNYETCQEDLDGDGVIGINDLMQLLSSFGTMCEEPETSEFNCGDPVNYHGYDYATVQIGDQCWFAENLRTELYQNGDSIPSDFSASDWGVLETGAYAVYESNENNLTQWGRMYNWFSAIDLRNVCPAGWSVPSEETLNTLLVFVEENEWGVAELKAESGWASENGSNLSGFNFLPGGYRKPEGSYTQGGNNGYLWTISSIDEGLAFGITIGSNVYVPGPSYKVEGFSIRCLKDTE